MSLTIPQKFITNLDNFTWGDDWRATRIIKEILSHLNTDKNLRTQTLHERINDSYYIGREIQKIYVKIFTYITKFLISYQIEELVDYWLKLDASPNGYKNNSIHIEFAKLIKRENKVKLNNCLEKLLKRAESSVLTLQEKAV